MEGEGGREGIKVQVEEEKMKKNGEKGEKEHYMMARGGREGEKREVK